MADDISSHSAKRNFSDVQDTCVRRPKDEQIPPPKKKMKTKLIDLFKVPMTGCNTDECMIVYLRVKPFTHDEDSKQRWIQVIQQENALLATLPDSNNTLKAPTRGTGKSSVKYTFSQIFNEQTNQSDFFNSTMLDMTRQFIEGQNGLLFSYGVTSSGKTYTIQGKPQDAGVLPRSLDVLFNSIEGKHINSPRLKPDKFMDVVRLTDEEVADEKKMKSQTLKMGMSSDPTMTSLMESVLSDTNVSSSSAGGMDDLLTDVVRDREKLKVDVEDNIRFGVWVSFAEVYNEKIHDLLDAQSLRDKKQQSLRIGEDSSGNPYIRGLKEIHVESADEAYRLLTIGQRNLQTACTRLNHCSSRSHCIFNIKIVRIVDKEDPNIAFVSTLSICDLAGSERYSKTQATGDRLKEAGLINTSLMTLGRCIETLRYNQLHRDQQRRVPFRDSKLTRILQNYFVGHGKAAMVVNVSQEASMLHETLPVLKFSATAQKVKYVNPPEPKKLVKKKAATLPHRQTIAWEPNESVEMFESAQSLPLPEEDEDDLGDYELERSGSSSVPDDTRAYIKALEKRNEDLLEMLEEQMSSAAKNLRKVRQEVAAEWQQRMVFVEENYSALLRDLREEQEEGADERVKTAMEVYEQRLERIQKKVDDDDEWVSSLLYHQEKLKVEELEKKCQALQQEKEAEARKHSDDTDNSILMESLTQKLQDLTDSNTEKNDEIKELKAVLEEAGDTFNKHKEEIENLKRCIEEGIEIKKEMDSKLEALQKEIDLVNGNFENSQKALYTKEQQMKTARDEWTVKLKSKDNTISSLEEECKELQGEIENLQDQMSQIDELSRFNIDSSTASESKLKLKQSLTEAEKSISKEHDCNQSELKVGKENICDSDILTKLKQKNKEMLDEISNTKTELGIKCKEIIDLKEWGNNLQSMHSTSLAELEAVQADLSECKHTLKNRTEELEAKEEKLKQSGEDILATREQVNKLENDIKQLQEENFRLGEDNKVLENAKTELVKEVQELQRHDEQLLKGSEDSVGEISEMVKMIEEKTTPHQTPCKTPVQDSEDDSEIVFNLKSHTSSGTKTPLTSSKTRNSLRQTPECSSSDLALKLKSSELANAALRSKLKHEEEDFFKREQALIHGYTAEIDSLKYELAKFKNKSDCGNITNQRGKKRTFTDSSTCSTVSDSNIEGVENKESDGLINAEKQSVAVLSNEVVFLQEQLTSLTSAFRQVNKDQTNNEAVLQSKGSLLAKAARFSIDKPAAPRYSLTNSLLVFEQNEVAMKIEEMTNKIAQMEDEVKTLNGQIETERTAKVNVEEKYNHLLANTNETSQAEAQLLAFKEELQGVLRENKEVKEALSTKQGLETELEEKELHISELTNKINTIQNQKNEVEEAVQTSEQRLDVLTAEVENLTEKLATVTSEKDCAETDFQQVRGQFLLVETELKEWKDKTAALETDVQEKNDKLSGLNESLLDCKKLYGEVKTELEDMMSQNRMLQEKCQKLEQILVEKESLLKNNEMNYSEKLKSLENKLSCEGKTKHDAISSLESNLVKAETLLEEKSRQLATVETLRQEEAADWAQKIICMEREKKAAERKVTEAIAKKEELQLKFQGSEKLSEEVEKLRLELKEVSKSSKEKQILIAKLKDNLASKPENEQPDLLNKIELESQLEDAKRENQQLVTEKNDLLSKVEALKIELMESEKTMDQQDEVLTKQDEDINDLKTELESAKTENEKSDKAITRMDLELAHQHKQLERLKKEKSEIEESKRKLERENETQKQNMEKEQDTLKQQLQEIQLKISKASDDMKDHDVHKKMVDDLKQRIEETGTKMEEMECSLQEKSETIQALEKDLQKQESINKRNKEEMENWKAEKDSCVKQLEQHISKVTHDREKLTEEVEKLKKSNADLAQEATNISLRKGALISDLKKSNNTMSIQLADAQGQTPPPKMATPETIFPGRMQFEEDIEQTGQFEMDVTPIPLKKGKKRQASLRSISSSSVDPEATPEPKCLRTIKEETESPLSLGGRSPRTRVAEIACEVVNTLSPFTRSSGRKQSKKNGSKSSKPPPFETVSFGTSSANESQEEAPMSTRRSSRLKKQSSKHSIV